MCIPSLQYILALVRTVFVKVHCKYKSKKYHQNTCTVLIILYNPRHTSRYKTLPANAWLIECLVHSESVVVQEAPVKLLTYEILYCTLC